MTFADQLLAELERARVTRTKMGELTGYGQARVSQILVSENLTERTVRTMAAALGQQVSLAFAPGTRFVTLQNRRIAYASNPKTETSSGE